MNFVHFGDTHLGGSNFKLREREQDFLDVFKQVIDYCVKERPDFVIHSGDIFDKGKPGNEILLFLINQLKRLKKLNIPFLIVPGSHDVSVDGTFIDVLDKVGLLINVAKKENYLINENEIILKGIDIGPAVIYGMPGRRANVKKIYEMLRPKLSNKFNIFVFHHMVSEIESPFSDIPISLLPKGFDYYAGGHWHEHEIFTYFNRPVVYPGSLEYTDLSVIENGRQRGFIHYKDGEINFVKVKTRDVQLLRINCNNLTPDECVNKCISNINESSNGLIVIKLHGILKSGRRSEIDIEKIKEFSRSKGWLHCIVQTSDLVNPGVVLSFKSVDEVEKEVLKSKGYNEKEIETGLMLLNELGKEYTPSELNKVINNLVKKLGGQNDNKRG